LSARNLTLRHNRLFVPRVIVVLAAIVSAYPVATASAQRRAPDPPPKVMITPFSSAEKDLGAQAAEAVRSRISKSIDEKKVTVIPKDDINSTLTASGYSTNEPLAPNDAKALANILRSDEYVEGTVSRTPTGVKIDARLVLARDNSLQQPLPSAEAAKLDQAAQMVARSYTQAREQLAAEKSCYTLFREGKFAEAEAMARSGLAKFPTGTIIGVCLGNSLQEQKKTDSVLAVAERIRAVDPRNTSALRWAADIYQTRGDSEKATQALTGLLAADPSNDRLVEQVVNSLAASGKAAVAVPIIMEAVQRNPGDPKTLRTAPVLAGDVLIVVSEEGSLTAVDRRTGRRRWSLRDRDLVGPAIVVAGQVVVAAQDGVVRLLDLAGHERRRWRAEPPAGSSPLEGRLGSRPGFTFAARPGFVFGPTLGGGSAWLGDESVVFRLGDAP